MDCPLGAVREFKDPSSHVSNLCAFAMLSSLCECDLHLNESSWWRRGVGSVVLKRVRTTGCSCGQAVFWVLCFGKFR